MPPYVVDANLLIRIATFDIPEQARQTTSLLESLLDQSVELPLYILAEVVYVLASHTAYQYPRSQITSKLVTITSLPQFSLDHATAHQALNLFSTTTLDFADCLLLAQNHTHHQTVLTFDKPLLRKLKQPLRSN